MNEPVRLRWIEFKPRPRKDGLHDSGYRHIKLTGVDGDGNRHDLGEWHDHLIVEPACNIDVEPDGTIRIMPWSDVEFTFDGVSFFASSAWINSNGKFR